MPLEKALELINVFITTEASTEAKHVRRRQKLLNMRRTMLGKLLLYIFVTILVIWAMDSVNINQIFKKKSCYAS